VFEFAQKLAGKFKLEYEYQTYFEAQTIVGNYFIPVKGFTKLVLTKV